MISAEKFPKKPVECVSRQFTTDETPCCACQWAEFCYKDCPCGCCTTYYPGDFDELGHEIPTTPDLCERCQPHG